MAIPLTQPEGQSGTAVPATPRRAFRKLLAAGLPFPGRTTG